MHLRVSILSRSISHFFLVHLSFKEGRRKQHIHIYKQHANKMCINSLSLSLLPPSLSLPYTYK